MILKQRRFIGLLTTTCIGASHFIRPAAAFSVYKFAFGTSAIASRPLWTMGAPTRSSDTSTAANNNALALIASSVGSSVNIYPYGSDLSHLNGGTVKVLHLIRHAEGFHNVQQDYRAIANLDARLTPLGVDQCQRLAQRIQEATPSTPLYDLAAQADLIVTSTLTRCMQTTLLSLSSVSRTRAVPILAHESIRETVNFNCDRRRPISVLSKEFTDIDFAHVPNDEDEIWQASVTRLGDDSAWIQHRESSQLHTVAARGRDFFAWLQHRPEQHIVVCSHCAFLRCLLHYGHSGDEIPGQPPQILDERAEKANVPPVVGYGGFTVEGLRQFQADFANCELRSVVVHFPNA